MAVEFLYILCQTQRTCSQSDQTRPASFPSGTNQKGDEKLTFRMFRLYVLYVSNRKDSFLDRISISGHTPGYPADFFCVDFSTSDMPGLRGSSEHSRHWEQPIRRKLLTTGKWINPSGFYKYALKLATNSSTTDASDLIS